VKAPKVGCFVFLQRTFVRAIAVATGQCPRTGEPCPKHGLRPKPKHGQPHEKWPTARPKANAETLPDPKPSLNSTSQSQRTANLAHEANNLCKPLPTPEADRQKPRNLNSGSWPMPRWVHRFNDKMFIFTNRNNADRLEVNAAQAIAADR